MFTSTRVLEKVDGPLKRLLGVHLRVLQMVEMFAIVVVQK